MTALEPPGDLLGGAPFVVRSYGPAAAYAGWLLRQFGATVDHETALDPEGLGAFLGAGARFAASPALERGASGTLITDAPVTPERRALLESMAAEREVVWITPWALQSEASAEPWSDLLVHAAGGWMHAVGEPGREPLGPPGAQGQFVAGQFAAIAAARGALGQATPAGLINVPMVESVAATCIYDAVSFQYFGRLRERVGKRFAATQPTLVTLPCPDGYIGIHAALHPMWVKLCQLIGHPELVDDPRFATPLARAENTDALDVYLLEWLSGRGRWEAYHALQGVGIPSAPIPDLAEVLASPHLAAREAWATARTPSGREYRVPGPPARVAGVAPSARAEERPAGPWLPGRLRVVDLSMGWAGPLVSHILACLGADVIKVESPRRFDWWRGSRPPGDDPSLALHERSHVFNTVNRGKRGLTLDLQTPEGNALGRALLESADVVVENFGAGVMEKLGLAFDQVAPANPGVIMLRQPGMGSTGPERGYRVFGNTIEGMSGLTGLMGYEDGPPTMMSNALGDPVSGLNGTLAVLAALAARSRDGRGRCIEAAQLEGFLPLVSAELIEVQQTGVQPARRANRRHGAFLSGVFQAGDGNRWVAIEARANHAPALNRLLGSPADPTGAFAQWLAARPRDAAVAELIAAGIPAAPVNSEADLLGGERRIGPGFWEGVEREVTGFHLYPSLPILLGGERPRPPFAAPTLGQHNQEILAGLGCDRTTIDALHERGVVGEWPA